MDCFELGILGIIVIGWIKRDNAIAVTFIHGIHQIPKICSRTVSVSRRGAIGVPRSRASPQRTQRAAEKRRSPREREDEKLNTRRKNQVASSAFLCVSPSSAVRL